MGVEATNEGKLPSRVRRSTTLLPFDAAADAGPLIFVDQLTVKYGLDSSAEIAAGYRLIVPGSAVIQLAAIHQQPAMIEEIEVWSTGGAIGLRNLLCLVMTEWKGKA